jgi:hypothetical protein
VHIVALPVVTSLVLFLEAGLFLVRVLKHAVEVLRPELVQIHLHRMEERIVVDLTAEILQELAIPRLATLPGGK